MVVCILIEFIPKLLFDIKVEIAEEVIENLLISI